ncbi:MAG: hypothetical protein IJ904_00605 [Candidatus Methanomethylophilaceae archaeon]|nr:hypothetical protein [Candidatus Methanomethylophilaceae archaeon]
MSAPRTIDDIVESAESGPALKPSRDITRRVWKAPYNDRCSSHPRISRDRSVENTGMYPKIPDMGGTAIAARMQIKGMATAMSTKGAIEDPLLMRVLSMYAKEQ